MIDGLGDLVDKSYTCDACGLTETVKCQQWNIPSFVRIKIESNQKALDLYGKQEFDICGLCYIKSLGVKPK